MLTIALMNPQAHQIGILTDTSKDKKGTERWQKLSLWSWALGSICTVGTGDIKCHKSESPEV